MTNKEIVVKGNRLVQVLRAEADRIEKNVKEVDAGSHTTARFLECDFMDMADAYPWLLEE